MYRFFNKLGKKGTWYNRFLINDISGLEFSVQMDFVDSVEHENLEPWKELTSGKMFPRKAKNFLPHDLGDPEEEPWKKVIN